MTRFLFLLLIWIAALVAFGQTNWHDPALDGVNVNLGYLNSDINGAFENLPHRISQTNMIQTKEDVTAIMNSNIAGMYTNYPPAASNAANRANLVKLLTNSFSNFSSLGVSMPVSNNFDGSWTGGTNTAWTISLPYVAGVGYQTATMNVSLSSGGYINPEFCRLIRSIIIALEYFALFWLIAADLKSSVHDLLGQRQMEGSKQSVLGTNVAAGLGATYAVALTAALVVTITAVFNYSFFSEVRSAGSGSAIITHLQTLAAYPAWEVLTAFIPVSATVIVGCSYALFKYVFLTPLFLGVRAIVLWFLA